MPKTRMMVLGVSSQMRVLDSLSYFFMMASTSAALPTEVSTSGGMFVRFSLSLGSINVLLSPRETHHGAQVSASRQAQTHLLRGVRRPLSIEEGRLRRARPPQPPSLSA